MKGKIMSKKSPILCVDDDPMFRSLYKKTFSDEYDVVTAESGEEALKIKQSSHFHLVITDLKMPGMDGIELIKQIRADDPLTFIIAVTAHSKLFELLKMRRLLCDDYFLKPFDPNELRESARQFTERFTRWLGYMRDIKNVSENDKEKRAARAAKSTSTKKLKPSTKQPA